MAKGRKYLRPKPRNFCYSRFPITEIYRFGVSGTAGFVVDAGIVYLCTGALNLGPLLAQAIAFTVAVIVTWLINRHLTFADRASHRWMNELTRYIATNSVGALTNNSIYATLVIDITLFSQNPVLAVAAGALAGMCFNYVFSKSIVFNGKKISSPKVGIE